MNHIYSQRIYYPKVSFDGYLFKFYFILPQNYFMKKIITGKLKGIPSPFNTEMNQNICPLFHLPTNSDLCEKHLIGTSVSRCGYFISMPSREMYASLPTSSCKKKYWFFCIVWITLLLESSPFQIQLTANNLCWGIYNYY